MACRQPVGQDIARQCQIDRVMEPMADAEEKGQEDGQHVAELIRKMAARGHHAHSRRLADTGQIEEGLRRPEWSDNRPPMMP
jgi:hypothetical protein